MRDRLARIVAPTLILHRDRSRFVPVGHGRYLAAHIAGSRYVERPGAAVLYWVGDTAPMLDEMEEFITGVRAGFAAERVLATIVFTDIVGSTERAAALGDDRWRDLLEPTYIEIFTRPRSRCRALPHLSRPDPSATISRTVEYQVRGR